MNWEDKLQLAIEGSARDALLEEMTKDAGNWSKCAVGELRKELEERGYDFMSAANHPEPLDKGLEILGVQFWEAVKTHEYKKALDLYNRIKVVAEGRDLL